VLIDPDWLTPLLKTDWPNEQLTVGIEPSWRYCYCYWLVGYCYYCYPSDWLSWTQPDPAGPIGLNGQLTRQPSPAGQWYYWTQTVDPADDPVIDGRTDSSWQTIIGNWLLVTSQLLLTIAIRQLIGWTRKTQMTQTTHWRTAQTKARPDGPAQLDQANPIGPVIGWPSPVTIDRHWPSIVIVKPNDQLKPDSSQWPSLTQLLVIDDENYWQLTDWWPSQLTDPGPVIVIDWRMTVKAVLLLYWPSGRPIETDLTHWPVDNDGVTDGRMPQTDNGIVTDSMTQAQLLLVTQWLANDIVVILTDGQTDDNYYYLLTNCDPIIDPVRPIVDSCVGPRQLLLWRPAQTQTARLTQPVTQVDPGPLTPDHWTTDPARMTDGRPSNYYCWTQLLLIEPSWLLLDGPDPMTQTIGIIEPRLIVWHWPVTHCGQLDSPANDWPNDWPGRYWTQQTQTLTQPDPLTDWPDPIVIDYWTVCWTVLLTQTPLVIGGQLAQVDNPGYYYYYYC